MPTGLWERDEAWLATYNHVLDNIRVELGDIVALANHLQHDSRTSRAYVSE